MGTLYAGVKTINLMDLLTYKPFISTINAVLSRNPITKYFYIPNKICTKSILHKIDYTQTRTIKHMNNNVKSCLAFNITHMFKYNVVSTKNNCNVTLYSNTLSLLNNKIKITNNYMSSVKNYINLSLEKKL